MSGMSPTVAQHDEVVLAAGRHAVLDDVGHGQVRPAQCLVGLGGGGLGRLHLGGEILGTRQQRGPLVPGRRRDLLAQRLLLRPYRLEPLRGGAALLVGAQQVVHQRRWTRRAAAGWHGSGRGLRGADAGQSRRRAYRPARSGFGLVSPGGSVRLVPIVGQRRERLRRATRSGRTARPAAVRPSSPSRGRRHDQTTAASVGGLIRYGLPAGHRAPDRAGRPDTAPAATAATPKNAHQMPAAVRQPHLILFELQREDRQHGPARVAQRATPAPRAARSARRRCSARAPGRTGGPAAGPNSTRAIAPVRSEQPGQVPAAKRAQIGDAGRQRPSAGSRRRR